MNRCSLWTSLQLRASLSRPQCIYSRLPHHARSLTFASTLSKDKSTQASPEPKQQDGTVKSSKKKKEDSKGGDDDSGAQKKGKESKARKTKKPKSESDATKKGIDGTVGRRARVRKLVSGTKDSNKTVERKIAEMRKQIEAIQAAASVESHGEASPRSKNKALGESGESMSLKDALLGAKAGDSKPKKRRAGVAEEDMEKLDIKHLSPEDLDFVPVDHKIPPVPKLSYGLDRVLFNPGVYRLQDPRSRVYNFDPYLEKIMSVDEFNFSALSEYKTSSKDEELLALTQRMGTKFTGSTSSMTGALQHFHFLLSNFRGLNHEMLSQSFPKTSDRFSKITEGPSAIFLRWKDGIYAIDADKAYDTPNIMSWLGHSLEKLLTVERKEFERYRRSSNDVAPGEDESSRCYHYSQLGNFLMRSQLDAHDPRLPGTGIFDLKTRAVVSIRMNHEEYETGKGYQIRHDRGEWESFEREFYDMTRATMLKYSLQVRMGRMDGIFVAYHNVERIFGFQYLPLEELDTVLHGQKDTCLGDQEFKMSIALLDELMQKATEKFPEQTLRLHFHTHKSGRGNPPFMYIFAEPVTEEQADEIQNRNQEAYRAFERDVVGIQKDDPALQAEWHEIQDRVDEELDGEEKATETQEAAEVPDEEELDEVEQELDAPSTEKSAEGSSEPLVEDVEKAEPEIPTGPLMGWTLAVRHRVNGSYVHRPANLTADDSWKIEYHIRELSEEDRWKLYEKVKTTRNKLIGEEREKSSESLHNYRQLIKRYSDRGREWRQEQDALAAQTETRVFQPLGPGSEV